MRSIAKSGPSVDVKGIPSHIHFLFPPHEANESGAFDKYTSSKPDAELFVSPTRRPHTLTIAGERVTTNPRSGPWAVAGLARIPDQGRPSVLAAPADPAEPRVAPETQSTSAYVSRGVKRGIDVAGSLAALAFFAPLMLIVTFLLLVLDFGPVFYSQSRIGRSGRTFAIYKFRTMCTNADEVLRRHLTSDPEARREWGNSQKLKSDPRVTWFGRLLRMSSIDELPQFFNVLFGDMSIVGPRPIVADELPRYGRYASHYMSCRPGITGLWQVSGRNNTTYRRRVAIDTSYSRSICFFLDMRIMALTIPAIFKAEGCS